MANLTADHKAFLARHNISIDAAFDAFGMTKATYRELMRDDNKLIAYGLNPCPRGGHTLRTRTGSCPQCDASAIAYLKRYREPACVYIAGSKTKKRLKIGVSRDIVTLSKRIGVLNARSEGDASDWEEICHVFLGVDAYRIEAAVHKEMAPFRVVSSYENRDETVQGRECYGCGYVAARTALFANIDRLPWGAFKERDVIDSFEFGQN